jgi:hypothetical protein
MAAVEDSIAGGCGRERGSSRRRRTESEGEREKKRERGGTKA